jgi:NADH dehydrogenase (ubiquinone) Fe-S protein 6
MDTIPPPEVFYSASTRVACDGDEDAAGGGGPNGHPRVYLQMGPSGFADCGYCDRRFILTGGPADLR